MTDEAFEKYQSVWTAVHNLVDKMLSGEAGAEDIRDKLTDEFRFWKRSGHDISATTPQPEQESFSNEAISATQAAWKMGYDAAKAEQPEQEPVPGVVMRYGFPTLLPDRDIKSTDVRLYTTPPQRTWVGLMDEQIDNVTRKQVDALLDHIYEYGTAAEGIDLRVRAVARAIEAKLKEKNA